jgi:hypothetical protein
MQNISIGLVGNNLALWTKFQTLTETQAISGGTLLPGFSITTSFFQKLWIKLNASFKKKKS